MMETREVEKNEIYRKMNEGSFELLYNSYKKKIYRVNGEYNDVGGYTRPVRVCWNNHWEESKNQKDKELNFLPVYTKSSYEKYLKDEDEELEIAGYILTDYTDYYTYIVDSSKYTKKI